MKRGRLDEWMNEIFTWPKLTWTSFGQIFPMGKRKWGEFELKIRKGRKRGMEVGGKNILDKSLAKKGAKMKGNLSEVEDVEILERAINYLKGGRNIVE